MFKKIGLVVLGMNVKVNALSGNRSNPEDERTLNSGTSSTSNETAILADTLVSGFLCIAEMAAAAEARVHEWHINKIRKRLEEFEEAEQKADRIAKQKMFEVIEAMEISKQAAKKASELRKQLKYYADNPNIVIVGEAEE